MANSTNHLIMISAIILTISIISPASASSGHEFNWISNRGSCSGSIADCIAAGETEMESESTRRMLAATRYISFGALRGNNVLCSQRGASYYNCGSGRQVVNRTLTNVVAVLLLVVNVDTFGALALDAVRFLKRVQRVVSSNNAIVRGRTLYLVW